MQPATTAEQPPQVTDQPTAHNAAHPSQKFKDPTFTPLRTAGKFQAATDAFSKNSSTTSTEQKKKDENDPDFFNLNPDIIALCSRNGMARGALECYLDGQLTWVETLETMVTALGRELLMNQKILVEARTEAVSLYNTLYPPVPPQLALQCPASTDLSGSPTGT